VLLDHKVRLAYKAAQVHKAAQALLAILDQRALLVILVQQVLLVILVQQALLVILDRPVLQGQLVWAAQVQLVCRVTLVVLVPQAHKVRQDQQRHKVLLVRLA
jgi:hypothetical protein